MRIYTDTLAEAREAMDCHINNSRKNANGEVLTPSNVIDAMLDCLPKDVFEDPNLTWADPTAGKGYFLMAVFHRLDEGLRGWVGCKEARQAHIVSKMLHAVELDEENVAWMRAYFGAGLQVFQGDVMAHVPERPYDVLVGNPPFQRTVKSIDNRRVLGGSSKLYEQILLRCLAADFFSGVGCTMVVPRNLFSGCSTAYARVVNGFEVTHLSFSSRIRVAFKKVQQPMCTFLLRRRCGLCSASWTAVEQEDGVIFPLRLSGTRSVNPVMEWTPETEALVERYVGGVKNGVKYHRGYARAQYGGEGELGVPIAFKQDAKLSMGVEDGRVVGRGQSKAVIFSMCPNLSRSVYMDYEGECGVGPNTFYVPFEGMDAGEKLAVFLRGRDYARLVTSTRTMRLYLKHALLQYVRFDVVVGEVEEEG